MPLSRIAGCTGPAETTCSRCRCLRCRRDGVGPGLVCGTHRSAYLPAAVGAATTIKCPSPNPPAPCPHLLDVLGLRCEPYMTLTDAHTERLIASVRSDLIPPQSASKSNFECPPVRPDDRVVGLGEGAVAALRDRTNPPPAGFRADNLAGEPGQNIFSRPKRDTAAIPCLDTTRPQQSELFATHRRPPEPVAVRLQPRR